MNKKSEEYIQILYQRHMNGESITQIAKSCNIDHSLVHYYFKSRNLKTTKGLHSKILYKTKWNENYFNIIDTENKAYWLGFIFSDGCITKNKNSYRLRLGIQIPDQELLYCFLQDTEATHYKIKQYDNFKKGVSKVELQSEQLIKDLISKGVTYRKSFEGMFFPMLSDNLYPSFIRGFIDGDGWIVVGKNNKVQIGMCCTTKSFLEKIQEILKIYNIRSTIYSKDNSKFNKNWQILYTLYISDNASKLKLLNLCYNNPNRYLKRKLLKANHANTVLSFKITKGLKTV